MVRRTRATYDLVKGRRAVAGGVPGPARTGGGGPKTMHAYDPTADLPATARAAFAAGAEG
ncbi:MULTISPECIES: hypothetical protein [unclassified Streptomyces]|uniref:hypothetical protein n=1 Tax=unclassified Streptomyces TaxID=2593676 RepID=UPI002E332078|nr:hypothetical protein [Streptomyces sp. NBC_01268]